MNSESDIDNMNELYPSANFSICVENLNEVLSTEPMICIKNTYSCYCYDDKSRESDFYYVKSKSGKITIKDVIDVLVLEDFSPNCNHQFLEGFDQSTPVQFTMFLGS